MRVITRLLWVDKRLSRAKKTYYITSALLDDGGEAEGYGSEFKVGDLVEVFYRPQYDKITMQKSKIQTPPI